MVRAFPISSTTCCGIFGCTLRHPALAASAAVSDGCAVRCRYRRSVGTVLVPEVVLKEYDPLLDSSCMLPSDWQRIAGDVRDSYYDYDGFVVVMGTDTMSYAASGVRCATAHMLRAHACHRPRECIRPRLRRYSPSPAN